LLNTSRNSSKSEHSALFLKVICNAAGQAAGCRRQNEGEKSKTSPNLRGGLPQFSRLGSLREQYFKRPEPGIDAASNSLAMRCHSVGCGMTDRTLPATQSDMRSITADHTVL
jgi:hypothetical protein